MLLGLLCHKLCVWQMVDYCVTNYARVCPVSVSHEFVPFGGFSNECVPWGCPMSLYHLADFPMSVSYEYVPKNPPISTNQFSGFLECFLWACPMVVTIMTTTMMMMMTTTAMTTTMEGSGWGPLRGAEDRQTDRQIYLPLYNFQLTIIYVFSLDWFEELHSFG